MDVRIEELQEQGDATKKAVEDNRAKLDAKNFKQAKFDSFNSARTDLDAKDKAQTLSVEKAVSATSEKQNTKQEAISLIEKVGYTVKSATDDATEQKKFKIDESITGGYKGIIERCEYLDGLDEVSHTFLIDNGMTQEDIDNIKAMPEKLRAANSAQIKAKKDQKTATEIRDAAAKVYKSEINKIRNFVKANFPKDRAMLIAFEPVSKGGGRGGNDTPPPTPPAQ